MASTTFQVRGFKIRTAASRRYALVMVRETAVHTDQGVLVPFARIEKRSDSLGTMQTWKRRLLGERGLGCTFVIIDTLNGEEV